MSKKLDTKDITRDLEGSAFFPSGRGLPANGSPPPAPAAPAGTLKPGQPAPVRPDARPATGRRKLVRHPFEFYEDQVERLRRLSLEAQLRGEKASMSEMVRDALDRYLAARAPKE